MKRQGKDESEEYKAVLETYARRHSWRRTYFGSHSKKLKSGTNLTGGKFHIVFDVKQDWCVPNICTQWWALHKHTVAGGKVSEGQGDAVREKQETNMALRAPARSAPFPVTMSFSPIRSKTLFW